MNYNRKIMRLELSAEKALNGGYYYAELLLPAADYEIKDAMQRTRAGGRENTVEVSILECDILPEIQDIRLDTFSLDELNFFAKRLSSLPDEELPVFYAVTDEVFRAADNDGLVSIKDLINCTYSLDTVPVAHNVSNLSELGRFAFENELLSDLEGIPESAVPFLNAEQIGRVQQKNDKGIFEGNLYMTEKGFTAERTKEAQVLYTLALYDYSKADGFVDKLVGCFAENQTDEQLIAAVNSAFGTELKSEDYSKIMNSIRANSINTSGFTDPHSKNNLDLVEWAKQAQSHGWGYVWGSYGEVLTQKTLNSKAEQYPDEVGSKADFIKKHWLGRRTADCIGLIKGYGWLNTQTGTIEYGTNGMPDIGADTMFNNATEKGTIDTLPEIPGLALWHSGHIGIYIGGGKVIHAANTQAGVIISDVSGSGFTHWLKIPYITYTENTESQ